MSKSRFIQIVNRALVLVLSLAVVATTTLSVSAIAADTSASNGTVTLCHKPGTPAERTLVVPTSAAPGHMGHGDTTGACGAPPPPPACGPRTPPPTPPDTGLPDENEQEFISEAEAVLEGASETAFLAAGAPVTFRLSCPTLAKDTQHAVVIYDNGYPLPFSALALTDNSVTLTAGLSNGRHELVLSALDVYGAAIHKQVVLWVGSHNIPVLVLNEAGVPVAGVTVTLKLADDPRVVSILATDANGHGTFTNLPNRSYNIIARSVDNHLATRPASVFDGTVVLRLTGFQPASAVDNNDFSQGLAGWEVGNAPVVIIPHEEGTNTATVKASAQSMESRRRLRTADSSAQLRSESSPPTAAAAPAPDFDLRLTTSGEGQQSISRSFQVEAGIKSVVVRFRFITTEVPGGYFGTEFNDFFNVSIRTLNGGGDVTEGNSMNGLGLAAFDASGATAWYQAELPVAEGGDTVQVDIAVANVTDEFLDSMVIVDGVKKKKIRISELQFHDIDGSSLEFLSASDHPYFGGNTRVHGTLTIAGPFDESLEELKVEVLEGGVIATGTLPANLAGTLYTTFGDTQEIKLDTSQLLFEIPAGQLAAANQAANGGLTLRVKARSSGGDTAERDFGPVTKLALFAGGARYGGRDAGVGGDDWAKPTVGTLIGGAGLIWGDFSNMNGGPFPPHKTHRTGNSADGWFNGYNARDAATAATIIDQLNTHGLRIREVYVTFAPNSAFANAIANVILNDGRAATSVVLNRAGHTNHFHWEVVD